MIRFRILFTLAMLLSLNIRDAGADQAPLDPKAEQLPDGVKVVKLEARPAKIELRSPFAYSQLLLTATLDNGETMDVTRIASVIAPPTKNVVTITRSGLVRPTYDDTGEIKAFLNGKSVTIPVTVTGMKSGEPVSFLRDVQPMLSKLGCNAGTCHGAQQGKNGFKLSLRGYDPIFDHRALTDDLEGRRFNRAAPEQSLMLLKTSGAIPHAGGVLTSPGEPAYEMLRRWVAEGVRLDLDATRVRSIEIAPKDPTVWRKGWKQQFAVIATYNDGSVRDVSNEAFIESSNTEVATVDKKGLLTAVRRGEATMLARFEGAYAASTVVVMGDRSGFTWNNPPVFNWIDELVDKKLKRVKVLPSPVCDDADFVRRVYLDLTGLPPTPEAVQEFLADGRESRAKRDELIDKLVGSKAYIEQWTNKWADLLQVNRKFLGPKGAAALKDWVQAAVAENRPYDKFAYDLLTASGSNVENPPASYFKVLRTPDAVMENTTQLFLAVRFNCNKCHDHPFERWTQDQYYQMAAFFAQVDRKEDPKFKGLALGGTAVEKGKPLVELIEDLKTGDVKHERTGEVTPPKFPYPIKTPVPTELSRRVRAAKWITDPSNPYFAKSFVNRIWSYLTGTGLIEPVDDIRAGNPASNPELLDRLTDEFVKSGFDTQKLIKLICQSRTYQLSISTNRWNKDDDLNYSHALPRRLSAESLYDAVHAVTGAKSKLPGLPAGSRAAQLLDSNVELPGGFLELFGKPVRESACECERSSGMNLGPVLAMVNGPIVADAIKDPNNRLAKIIAESKDDAKAVEAIYLAVLNRLPTAGETEAGAVALQSASGDLTTLRDEFKKRQAAFDAYKEKLDEKQVAWEKDLQGRKPTVWTVLEPTKTKADGEAKLTKQEDNSILVSGKNSPVERYTITAETKMKTVTGFKIEVMADKSLPKNGPGRAKNGNFVLSEAKVTVKPLSADGGQRPLVLTKAKATFSQAGTTPKQAIDNDLSTGWAIDKGQGKNHSIAFDAERAVMDPKGARFEFILEQKFGSEHNIGRFRVFVTDDPNPRLGTGLTPEQATLIDIPVEKRTEKQTARMRELFLEQDADYQRLSKAIEEPPPSDPRLLGAQDLVWALINSPAFLFNR